MSEEKKEGCCGSTESGSGCCGSKKLVVGLLVGALIFVAGMMFAKTCPLAQSFCPLPGMSK